MSDNKNLDLRAPFPWFGGKSRVADVVWEHFGDVPNYVEPFFGSGAVLLGRPHAAKTETVNDVDCFVVNFWRALQHEPEAVAEYADNPVNEADQHARHTWLIQQADWAERMKTDPDFYDVKIAGWWVWGQSIWIGAGWCAGLNKLPHLGDAGKGVCRKLPHLGDAGKGVCRQLPHLGNAGTDKREQLLLYMHGLAERLRMVRVCCGDWSRVCGPSVTFKHGITGVFLDPPYGEGALRQGDLYANDDLAVSKQVCTWAIENGTNPKLRIAVCGYEGEHLFPSDWECLPWKTAGGYGSQGGDNTNCKRERIWFSPHCIKKSWFQKEGGLF